MKLANKLCSLREEMGFSQEWVAETLGVTRQSVSQWECGATFPKAEKLIALSKLYGVDLRLLTDDDAELPTVPAERAEDSNRFRKRVRIAAGVLCGLVLYSALCISIGFAISKAQTKEVDITPIEEMNVDPADVVTVDGYFELGPW